MVVTAYIRVSTVKQTNDHWKLMLSDYAETQGLPEPEWMEENISGAKPWRSRKLGPYLKTAEPGDVLIVGEASRIGRNAADGLDFIREAKRAGVILHIRPLDPIKPNNGPDSATIILPVLFGMAEYEREQLSYRTKLGLARAKEQGKVLGGYRGGGRNPGDGTRADKAEILKAVKGGASINGTAKRFKVTRSTIYRWLKEGGYVK